jgi:hypothetical protein
MTNNPSRTVHPFDWLKRRFFSSGRMTAFMGIALIIMLVILIAIALYVAARPPSSEVPFLSQVAPRDASRLT